MKKFMFILIMSLVLTLTFAIGTESYRSMATGGIFEDNEDLFWHNPSFSADFEEAEVYLDILGYGDSFSLGCLSLKLTPVSRSTLNLSFRGEAKNSEGFTHITG
ncbi:hypothetical protein KAJ26_03380, partial [bacterium]|nr:hypothetical protein [bacterium]